MKNRVSSLFAGRQRIVGVGVLAVLAVAAILTIPSHIQAQKNSTTSAEEAMAIQASGKPLPVTGALAVANPQTAVACNMCFTCGGDWPIFAGAIHAINTGLLTTERGPGCSGALHSANDSDPFLCCR
jgi:hypothetical protein